MRPDALLIASGALTDVDAPDAGAVLEATAYRFLSAGGRLTLGEYSALSEESREAFLRAQERRDADVAEVVMGRVTDAADAVQAAHEPEAAQEAAEAMLGGL